MLFAQIRGGGEAGAALGVMVCVMAFALLIGTAVGAVILRAACALFNKMVGDTGRPARRRPREMEESERFGERAGGTGIVTEEDAEAGRTPALEDRGEFSSPLVTRPGVVEPEMGKAMGIVFLTYLVNIVVSFAVGFCLGAGAGAAGAGKAQVQGVSLLANLIALPISLLVLAGMISALLPTTFGKALLISLLYVLIGLVIVVIVAVIVVPLWFMLMAK
jgi:hypothetical protein